MVVITGHRRENFGQGFEAICDAIETLASRFPDHAFVYPVHLNPNVKLVVERRLGRIPNIKLLAPLDYSLFAALLKACRLVLTDSGGIQEEAPALGKPVLVMREVTERPEGVDAGTVALVGTDRDAIITGVGRLLTDERAYAAMAQAKNPYGDGHAAPRIVEHLRTALGLANAQAPSTEGAALG
jgi:UDP-N-acetylglucosamine 2-epimerase (non-hydrolysing)